MAAKPEKKNEVTVEDEELDDLLESALGDFGRNVPKGSEPDPTNSENVGFDDVCREMFGGCGISGEELEQAKQLMSGVLPEGDEGFPPEGLEAFEKIFTAEFAREAETQMKEVFEVLSKENPDFLQQFEKASKDVEVMAQQQQQQQQQQQHQYQQQSQQHDTSKLSSPHKSAQHASQMNGKLDMSEGVTKDKEDKKPQSRNEGPSFEATMEETLRRMQQNVQNAGKMDDLPGMFGGLNFGSESGEEGLLSMMENMMGTLLSKEVLYPPLKEFCARYPEWIGVHRDKLSDTDYKRYSEQLEVMRAVCAEFEKEQASDTQEEKQARFDKVMQLMHQLQNLGQPPEDLIKDSPGMNFLP